VRGADEISTEPTDTTATNGGNGRPSFGARLEAEEIQAAGDYIYATF
jgi:hypothetical protein